MKGGRIYCGDCLDVMHDMGSDSVDCIVTDPPYLVKRDEKESGRFQRWKGFERS